MLTKVCLVKAMLFPVVMYVCGSWIIRLSGEELMLLICGATDQSILKEISPEYSLEGLMLKLQYFGHLMRRANSLEKTLMLGKVEGRKRRRWQRKQNLRQEVTDSGQEYIYPNT